MRLQAFLIGLTSLVLGGYVMLTFYVSLIDLDFVRNKIWKRKDASACLLHHTGQETSLRVVDLLKSQDPEGQHHPPSSTFHLDS